MRAAAKPQIKSGFLSGVIALIALVALIGVCAFAYYSWHSNKYPSWREEVRLSDGRTIHIIQKHEYYANHGTTQSWVTFSLPEIGGERTWKSYLTPQRIDVVGGRVFVFGFSRGDRQYAYYNFPKNYMVAFVCDGVRSLPDPMAPTGPRPDLITGTVFGDAGDDRLFGSGEDDDLYGGSGNDMHPFPSSDVSWRHAA